MKTMKKMMAFVIACVMVLAMAAPVMAASITLTDEPDKYKDSHTYNVYQIFTGDIGTLDGKEVLQNVKYGANYGDTGASVPKSVLDAVGSDARAYAALLLDDDTTNGEVKGTPIATLTKDNGFKAENLATGYYLIVDTVNGSLAAGDALAQYIVQVLKDTTMETKKDVTESSKVITSDDHPATEGGDANPGVSTDGKTDNVSVGDKVNFTITAKVPAHATDYDYYYFIINDTLSAGLTLDPASIVVKTSKDNATLAVNTDYKVYTGSDVTPVEEGETPHTFEVALVDAKAHPGETITVTYSATLNENAVIGGEGNLNTETVTYSNNPNEKYDGTQDKDKPGKPDSTKEVPTGETPAEETKTFTSGIKLQKLDQDGNALSGASFTIEGDSINKIVKNVEAFEAAADGTYYKLKTGAYTTAAPQTVDKMIEAPSGATDGYVVAETDFEGATIEVEGKKYRVVNNGETPTHILKKKNSELYDSTETKYKKTTTETVEETTEHKSQELPVNADGTLNFKGLGAGTYTIKETVVPTGYTKAQDVTVVITFDNTEKKFTATVNGTAVSEDATLKLFPVDVVNVAGNVLPSTGGVGTKMFYLIGAILVLGAGILLVSRRRARV